MKQLCDSTMIDRRKSDDPCLSGIVSKLWNSSLSIGQGLASCIYKEPVNSLVS